MKPTLLPIPVLFLFAATAWGQSEVVYEIQRPAAVLTSAWGEAASLLSDLDGDGLSEVAVPIRNFGATQVGTVHSGADGSLLYVLNVPFESLWSGGSIQDVSDVTGDGIRDLVHCMAPSISFSNTGRISVFSGADGSLWTQYPAPAGMRIGSDPRVLQDLTGDGIEEVIVSAWTTTGAWVVFDPTTGQPVATIENSPQQPGFSAGLALLEDRNDDGVIDWAHPLVLSGQLHMVLRSGSNGAVLSTVALPGAPTFTGNGEPFVAISDVDGDGLLDLATGGVFEGLVTVHSTATGAELARWDCATSAVPCMGSRIIEVGDWNFDGSPDLMAVTSDFTSGAPVRRIVLDPRSGAILEDEESSLLEGAYAHTTRVATAPAIDELGMAHFLEIEGRVVLRRNAPRLGETLCNGDSNMKLTAVGSPVFGVEPTALELTGMEPGQPAVVLLAGDGYASAAGLLGTCLMGPVARFGTLMPASEGSASIGIQHGRALTMVGSTWFFQAIARNGQTGGVLRSNGIGLRMR